MKKPTINSKQNQALAALASPSTTQQISIPIPITPKKVKSPAPAAGANSNTIVQSAENASLWAVTDSDTQQIIDSPDGTIIVTTDKDVYVNTYKKVVDQKFIALGGASTAGVTSIVAGAGTSITSTGPSGSGAVTINSTVTSDPAGLDTQIQFNDNGAFGGVSGFTYNKSSGILACDAITFRNVYQTIVSLSGATGTVVHNFSLSSLFNHTAIVSNFTVNVTNLNLASGYVANITLVLTQGATAYMPTSLQIAGSVQTIYWVYGVQPVGTVNGRDIVNFSVTNIDDTYSVFGQSVSYS